VQSSLDYKQRLQQLFFPEGVAFDGNRFNRTVVTAELFKYLVQSESADEGVACQPKLEGAGGPPSRPSSQHAMADNLRPEPERRFGELPFASWNQLAKWMIWLDSLQRVA
jgi:hypothetical protein